MVGRLGFAPSSRRLRAGTSLSKFATRKLDLYLVAVRQHFASLNAGYGFTVVDAITVMGIFFRHQHEHQRHAISGEIRAGCRAALRHPRAAGH